MTESIVLLPCVCLIRYLNGVPNKVASDWIKLYLLHFDTCKFKNILKSLMQSHDALR